MEDIFFNGIWRMDWGLGNPNKTATLIAELMVAVWGLVYVRKRGFWVTFTFFIILGGCLIHTFSRGGLVAAMAGLIALIAFVPRPWPLKKCVAIGISVLLMTAFALYLNAHERYGQGVIKEDRSINNRVELWKVAPVMMVDAPAGWGIGNAGKAFMRWYQPAHRNEQYRTLVNSHLTWLVEFGWQLRFLYLFAWAAVFLLCLPTKESRWYTVPLGIWLSFGTSAFFSSVAESIWLWIVPCLSLALVLGNRLRMREWPRSVAWVVPVGVAALFCASFLTVGKGKTEISGSKDLVVIGKNVPLFWLVVDERTLGNHDFAKSLRKYLAEHPTDRSIGVVQSLASLPKDEGLSGTTIVVAGSPEGRNQASMQWLASSVSRLILLAPSYYPQEAGFALGEKNPVEVIFGEFSQSPFLMAWEEMGKVRRIAGTGDFFPNWPQIVFDDDR